RDGDVPAVHAEDDARGLAAYDELRFAEARDLRMATAFRYPEGFTRVRGGLRLGVFLARLRRSPGRRITFRGIDRPLEELGLLAHGALVEVDVERFQCGPVDWVSRAPHTIERALVELHAVVLVCPLVKVAEAREQCGRSIGILSFRRLHP